MIDVRITLTLNILRNSGLLLHAKHCSWAIVRFSDNSSFSLAHNLVFSATYYSYDRYYYLKNSGSPDEQYGIAPAFAGEFNYYLGLKKTWLAFGEVFFAFEEKWFDCYVLNVVCFVLC